MKNIIITLAALLTLSLQVQAQGVRFMESSLKEVLKKAKNEKKLVFIDCYTAWCVPCANMAKNIFPQKVCGDFFNKTFISTKYDMEKGEGLELQKRFKCIMYPTFIILDADGKEVNRLTGGTFDASAFVEKVKAAINPDNSIDALKSAYEQNKSMQTGLPYAKAMYDHGYNVADVLEDIYMHSQEYDRYNTEFLTYYLNSIDFRSDKFDRLMADKFMWNLRLGRETVDRMIFDTYRKTMYLVAAGRPHELTPADVRKAAMITGLLELNQESSEKFLPTIASCVISEDWEGFTDVYTRRIIPAPDNSFKTIVIGFIEQYFAKLNDSQKERIIHALNLSAKSGEYQHHSVTGLIERLGK